MKYTVKKLAAAASISVRALHHYDNIGLLKPAGLEENGYRYYGESELLRLQQIMFFRELEFPLSKIKEIVDAPTFDNLEALENHRQVLLKQKVRLTKLVQTIDYTISNLKNGVTITTNDLYQGFTKQQMKEYTAEAKARWGSIDAYKQSVTRTKTWSKEKFIAVFAEAGEVMQKMVGVMDRSVTDPAVQALVSAHRQNINHFYDVSDEIYGGLAETYVTDARFAKRYEDIAPGLANFLSLAMLSSLTTPQK